MKTRIPVLLTKIGGVLIFISGIISLGVALTFGAVIYEVDPNGLFGHVSILAGLAAMLIGGILYWFSSLDHQTPRKIFTYRNPDNHPGAYRGRGRYNVSRNSRCVILLCSRDIVSGIGC